MYYGKRRLPLDFSSVKAGDIHLVGRELVPRRNAKSLRGGDQTSKNLFCPGPSGAPALFFNLECLFQTFIVMRMKKKCIK